MRDQCRANNRHIATELPETRPIQPIWGDLCTPQATATGPLASDLEAETHAPEVVQEPSLKSTTRQGSDTPSPAHWQPSPSNVDIQCFHPAWILNRVGHKRSIVDHGTDWNSNVQVTTRSRPVLIGRIVIDLFFELVGLTAGMWTIVSRMGDHDGFSLDVLIVVAIAVGIYQCICDTYRTWKRHEELHIRNDANPRLQRRQVPFTTVLH